jgi:hypothetical protein
MLDRTTLDDFFVEHRPRHRKPFWRQLWHRLNRSTR